MAVGDLNGDGRLDLVVVGGSASVSVLLASGAPGSFAAKVDYVGGNNPISVALGDLNGDGRLDLAVANYASNTVSVLLASGAPGSFAAKVDYATGSSPYFVALGDLNGDGQLDLAVANYGSNSVSVLLASGTLGSFAAKVDYASGNNPISVALGDLNSDGRLDLAVANYTNSTVSVLLNQPALASLAVTVPAGAQTGAVFSSTATALDGCGATLAGYNGPVTIAIKTGTGTLGAVLGGTLSVNAVNGVATFSNLTIDRGGTGYVLTAVVGTASGDSAPFTVNTLPLATPQIANGSEDTDLLITLAGSDADSDPLSYIITALPGSGTLYQSTAGGTRGAPIASVPTTISDASQRVIFAAAANANGSPYTSFAFTVNDGTLNSAAATVTVNIASINDAPAFTKGADQSVAEDAGAQSVSGWATGISAGPVDESGQIVSFLVTNGNNPLFASQPAVAANGTLTYTPAANANGSATVTLQAQNTGGIVGGGVDTSAAQTFTITITSVNDAPVASDGSLPVAEDTPASGALVATDVDGNPLTYSIVVNGTKGVAAITNATTGAYSYTPNANATGSDSFTFKANDGTVDSNVATISITIMPVDDAPTLDLITDMSVLESAPIQTVSLSGISTGPADESGQALTVAATSSNPALIANPTVTYTSPNATGTLNFTPTVGQSGSATISVTVADDGSGVAPNANMFTRTFIVFVGAINNRPMLDQPADLSILEDGGAQTVILAGISVGAANESSQTLTVTAASSNLDLIANPTVTYSSPDAAGTLSYQPAADVSGTVTITVTVRDNGGTANGGIDFIEQVFTISVTPVNDAPSFTAGANQAATALSGSQTVAGWATGFTPGPADEAGQTLLSYTVVSNSNPTLFDVVPVVALDGTLSYTPKPGVGGTATIGLTVRDSGGIANGGVDTSIVKTFTITTGSSYRSYLSLITSSGTPDLVVASINLSPNRANLAAGEPVVIAVVIENRGDQTAGPFWVDLSINPNQPPTIANQTWNDHCALNPCYGLAWHVQELAPGARITLTSMQLAAGYAIWPGWFAAGTTDLYAYADSYYPGVLIGAVAERDETNNQLHVGGLMVTGTNPASFSLQSVAELRQRPVRLP